VPSSRFRTALAFALALALLAIVPFDIHVPDRGRSSGDSFRSPSASTHRSALSSSRSPIKCESCPCDSHGKIKRNPNAVSEFKRTHPEPPGCNTCEVDHTVPLSKEGRDEPSNMQWLPKAQHVEQTRQDLRP
jgi:hypothetical protein